MNLTKRLRNNIVLLLSILIASNTVAQDSSALRFPIDSGKVEIPDIYLSVNEFSGLYIKAGKDTVVRSSRKGIVVYLKKDKNNLYSLSVRYGESIFVNYSNLISTIVKIGQTVKGGEPLGLINKRTALKYNVKNGVHFINPREFLIYYQSGN